MDIRFTGQNLKITEGMKAHLHARLARYEKYASRLIETHIFLKKEKYLFKAEITLLARHLHAFGEGSSQENIFAAMDEAYERVEKQLKKFRSKTKDRKREIRSPEKIKRAFKMMDSENVLAEPSPRIFRAKGFAAKPMSVEEASLQLNLSSEIFLVFLNQETNAVNVIYKRKDGNHGLIEPAF